MNPEAVQALEQATNARYSRRYQQFGRDPRTLGWGSAEHQRIRFGAALSLFDLEGRSILDIGCGFGDWYGFLRDQGVRVSAYTGFDINEDLLREARQAHPEARFECRNLLREPASEPIADVTTMFGLINFRLTEEDNEAYAQRMIRAAWATCRRALIVDMLSAVREPSYPAEDVVNYFAPDRMLAFALTLTPNVVLKHDYPAIPQKECVLLLSR